MPNRPHARETLALTTRTAAAVPARRMPPWPPSSARDPGQGRAVEGLLGELRLNTVCHSARCPNRGECFAEWNCDVLIAGSACTRGCGFCARGDAYNLSRSTRRAIPVAEAARRMELSHVDHHDSHRATTWRTLQLGNHCATVARGTPLMPQRVPRWSS